MKKFKLKSEKILSNSFINLFITVLLLISYAPLIDCNDIYKALCTPSILQIKELIKHAFTIQNNNLTEFNRWTYDVNLQEFCKSNGFEDNKLPDLIKVSKLQKKRSEKKDQVDVLLTIKVPISKFFVDEDDKTSHKYWLLHKWPFEPFFCPSCRPFLTYSTKKNKNLNNKMTFIYGIMKNKYPFMVNPENFETIRREVKKKFFKQEFSFLTNQTVNQNLTGKLEGNNSDNNMKLDKVADHASNQSDVEKNDTIDHVTENQNSFEIRLNVTIIDHNSNKTTGTTKAWTTIRTSTNDVKSDFTTNAIGHLTTNTIEHLTTSSIEHSTTKATLNNTNQTTVVNNVTPDYERDLIKKTIYVNLSTFVSPERYFLVGMNMLSLEGIFSRKNLNKTINSTSSRTKRDTDQLLSIRADEFYLEYSLCYNSVANLYLPNANCYPLFIDDQLDHIDNNRSLAIGDCVCWDPHLYKSLIFYQVLLILVFIGLTLVLCNKLKRNQTIKQNLAYSCYNYSQTPGQILNKKTKIVVYQIILQIHNPNNKKMKLPGRLNVKLFTNLNQPFYEINFTSSNKFCRPFLFNDDILKTTSYIYSDTAIGEIKKLVVEFEASDDPNTFIYLYGIVITNGLTSTSTFPYSNYLAHRTEVHLCERSVWLNYISRHESLIPLNDILPICNPKCIKLSKIEKLLFIIIFSSKFASSALQSKDYDEDINWSIIFILDFISSLVVYMLFFTLYILYAKPLLNREYFFIKLNLEFIEIKFLIFICVILIFNSSVSSIYEINMNLWKDQLTIDTLRFFDKILFQNDLIWALNFFSSIALFLILTYFFEFFFYKFKKRESLSAGPSNSLADRLMTSQ